MATNEQQVINNKSIMPCNPQLVDLDWECLLIPLFLEQAIATKMPMQGFTERIDYTQPIQMTQLSSTDVAIW